MAKPDCPMPAAHDRFTEAHYFLTQVQMNFHEPDEFRWNLNAFLQALKSVSQLANMELQRTDGFGTWWGDAKAKLQTNALLRQFAQGRDIVVHRGQLRARSKVQVGVFRDRRLKLAWGFEPPIDWPSSQVLRHFTSALVGEVIDAEHSAIGEQLGVRRTWVVADLAPDEDILAVCFRAWAEMGPIVVSGHGLAGATMEPIPGHHQGHTVETVNVLLESDLDPSLPVQWGWE